MGIKSRLQQLAWSAAPEGLVASEEIQVLRRQVADLRLEVERLKKDVDEARRDSLRIAELTDLVVEKIA
ncbi:DUF6752 domain-containing protein [Microbacterium sp. MPKO10]|uniref:DUF6752 domain-containing protein n=1 Tax=Microbacterium sp. MPKO10 TaxID=2989818 RepID=UPI002235C4D3|nr:hypothetical protein [Microbacterium sp. MPKO10]MCW4457820.1 hypothetical protein [Microbacterium sp. MPKO10]